MIFKPSVRWVMLGVALGFVSTSVDMDMAQADEVYTFVVKKQEEKRKSGWNLTDWLQTRDQMRLQDLWLALHSPSPYEFFVGGAYQWGTSSAGSQLPGYNVSAGAYVSAFGLEYHRETQSSNDNARWLGLFRFRFFGLHSQGTNLTLETGIKSQSVVGGASYRNALAGISATIYIAKYFGVEGLYRHYFEPTPNEYAGGTESRYEGTAFLDFGPLRVYGTYFNEEAQGLIYKGPLGGMKFYF